MDEKTTGIILRVRPLTETSLILHWITPDLGRIATVAKGARRPNSPLRGKLDLYFLAEFTLARSRRSDLHTLREARLLNPHAGLRTDLAYLRQAAYLATLIEQNTEAETPLPDVFALLLHLLEFLPASPATPLTVLAFELRLLQVLGLEAHETNLSVEARRLMDHLLTAPWPAVASATPQPLFVLELRQFLHGFLLYHLGRIPSGRQAALDPST